jgi:hypothetical protein
MGHPFCTMGPNEIEFEMNLAASVLSRDINILSQQELPSVLSFTNA